MKPRFRIERRGNGWCVAGMMGRTIYYDTCYPKVVGVLDFLTEWAGCASLRETEPNATATHGSEDKT